LISRDYRKNLALQSIAIVAADAQRSRKLDDDFFDTRLMPERRDA